jgi:hypothetical protein
VLAEAKRAKQAPGFDVKTANGKNLLNKNIAWEWSAVPM